MGFHAEALHQTDLVSPVVFYRCPTFTPWLFGKSETKNEPVGYSSILKRLSKRWRSVKTIFLNKGDCFLEKIFNRLIQSLSLPKGFWDGFTSENFIYYNNIYHFFVHTAAAQASDSVSQGIEYSIFSKPLLFNIILTLQRSIQGLTAWTRANRLKRRSHLHFSSAEGFGRMRGCISTRNWPEEWTKRRYWHRRLSKRRNIPYR